MTGHFLVPSVGVLGIDGGSALLVTYTVVEDLPNDLAHEMYHAPYRFLVVHVSDKLSEFHSLLSKTGQTFSRAL